MAGEPNDNKRERLHCNHCQVKTLHRLLKTATDTGTDEDSGYWWSTTFDMLQCCGCREVLLRRTFSFSENNEDEVRYFPPPVSRQPPSWRYRIPNNLQLLLNEIYRSLDADNRRLPMMGARTLVDMLILEKIDDVGDFKEKLKGLEKAGLVSSQGREILYAAVARQIFIRDEKRRDSR